MKNNIKSSNNFFRRMIIILIILLVLLFFTSLILRNRLQDAEPENVIDSNTITAEEIEQNAEERELEGLKDADERTRIQQYCGKFIRYIESKDYESAYNLLYPDFKNNYFKTLDDFTKYVQEKFPSDLIIVSYDNIERQGQYYVLFTTITSPLQPDYSMDQRFFFVENDFNDFLLSFEVKQ